MGIADRDYNRADGHGGAGRRFGGGGGSGGGFGGGGGGGLGGVLAWLSGGSVSLGTYLGIRVRVHASFVFVPLFFLLMGHSLLGATVLILALFGSVLLHEFGHALGCRAVGGHADDILMWPLGGLAFCRPPQRPWPEFVTVACGPLVNLVIAALLAPVLLALATDIGWHVLDPIAAPFRSYSIPPLGFIAGLVYSVNVVLLVFNVALVFYPFDGGRLVQILLWIFVGHRRSLLISSQVGMGGAVLVGLAGLAMGRLMLVLIAVFGFLQCRRTLEAIRHGGYAEVIAGGDLDWSAGATPSRRELRADKKRAKARAAEQQRTAKAEAEIDAILAKVARDGLQSLSGREKKLLEQRSRDMRGS